MAAMPKVCPKCGESLASGSEPTRKRRCGACGWRLRGRSTPASASRSLLVPLLAGGGIVLLAAILLVVHAIRTRGRPAAESEPIRQAAVDAPSSPAPAPPRTGQPSRASRPPVLPPTRSIPPPRDQRPAPPPADPPAAPRRPPNVEPAVGRGVAYLKARLADSFQPSGPNGYRSGVTALAGLTLLECGVPATDPAVVRAAKRVRATAAQLGNAYTVSSAIWFLDRLGDPNDEELIRTLSLQLIAAQTVNGGWGYRCPALTPKEREQFLSLLQANPASAPLSGTIVAASGSLAGRQASRVSPRPASASPSQPVAAPPSAPGKGMPPLAALRYQPGRELTFKRDIYDDNSSTQFAILALWTARKHGLPVDRSLALAAARFRACQKDDGSWGYRLGVAPVRQHSMTCAGLLGLAVGRGIDQQPGAIPEGAAGPAVEKGFRFLGEIIGRTAPLTAVQRAALQEQTAGVRKKQELFLAKIRQAQEEIAAHWPVVRDLINLDVEIENLKEDARPESMVRRVQLLSEREQQIRSHVAGLQRLDLAQKAARTLYPGGEEKKSLVQAKSWGDLYFLWSLQRMAVVYGRPTIGGRDWYVWGAEVLLAAQNDDGSWSDAFPGVVDTCFALLFLKRANVARDLSKKLEFLGTAPDAPPPPR